MRFHVDMNAWRTLFKQSTHPESGWNAESTEPIYFCRIWKLICTSLVFLFDTAQAWDLGLARKKPCIGFYIWS